MVLGAVGTLALRATPAMIGSLTTPALRIQRLSLVGCFTGLSELAPDRAPHRLADELWPLVRDRVVEISAYAGEVAAEWQYSVTEPATMSSVSANYLGQPVFAVAGTGKKIVTQQTRGSSTVPRKIIIDSNGRRWG